MQDRMNHDMAAGLASTHEAVSHLYPERVRDVIEKYLHARFGEDPPSEIGITCNHAWLTHEDDGYDATCVICGAGRGTGQGSAGFIPPPTESLGD